MKFMDDDDDEMVKSQGRL